MDEDIWGGELTEIASSPPHSDAHDSDDSSGFPKPLRKSTRSRFSKQERIKIKKQDAENEFPGFHSTSALDWSIDNGEICSSGFRGMKGTQPKTPSRGKTPSEHIAGLEINGYKKITIGFVLKDNFLNADV
jgi:hypothetical protein